MKSVLCAALALILAGAANAATSPPATSLPPAATTAGNDFVSRFQRLQNIVAVSENNCPAMAVAIEGFKTSDAPPIVKDEVVINALTADQAKLFHQDFDPALQNAGFQNDLQHCASDKSVQTAFSDFQKATTLPANAIALGFMMLPHMTAPASTVKTTVPTSLQPVKLN